MKILATYNIKGGVGKTAAAVNLAYLSARDGYRTLLWDLDPQGAASFYFRIRPRVKGGARGILRRTRPLQKALKATDFEGLDLIPADFSYRNLDLDLNQANKPVNQIHRLLKPFRGEYDFVFIDCAAGISLVSENVFHAADALLVPLIPTTLSSRTLHQLLRYLHKHPPDKLTVLPFFSMVEHRKRLHRETMQLLAAERQQLLQTIIPYSSQIELMGEQRAPLGSYGHSSTPVKAFEKLWAEVKSRL